MNITFMIGNGFDLNLGLETGYQKFYEYYVKRNPDDLIAKSIEKDYELWADLEEGLGLILKDIKPEQIDDFFDSKANLESELENYLIAENAKFQITDEAKFVEEFCTKIVNFHNGFSTADKNDLKAIISSTRATIDYQFITFNYTDVLDKMVALVNKKATTFTTHVGGGTRYTDTLKMPHHLHGSLGNEDLVLCVDNVSQIKNEAYQKDYRVTKYMIKSNVNQALGEGKTEKAKQIIDNSKYVCLFGLSIGDTDSTWWKYIIEWLARSSENRLVLFVRDNTVIHRSGAEKIRACDKQRAYFGKKGNCNSELLEKLNDRIIIVQNSKIFTYKNVTTKENNND